MLRLFQRYTRLFALHPVFSSQALLLSVLEYLNGQDLAEAVCVCFTWKSVILSEPLLEVRILKWKLSKAHATIYEMVSQISPPVKEVQRRPLPSFAPRKLSEKVIETGGRTKRAIKELSFKNLFHASEQKNHFPVYSRRDFESEDTWQAYSTSYNTLYNDFKKYLTQDQNKQTKKPVSPSLFRGSIAGSLYDRFISCVSRHEDRSPIERT